MRLKRSPAASVLAFVGMIFFLITVTAHSQDAQINFASNEIAEGRNDSAITVLESFLRDHPESLTAHFLLGFAYDKTGRAESACDHLKKVLDSGDPKLSASAMALMKQREYDRCLGRTGGISVAKDAVSKASPAFLRILNATAFVPPRDVTAKLADYIVGSALCVPVNQYSLGDEGDSWRGDSWLLKVSYETERGTFTKEVQNGGVLCIGDADPNSNELVQCANCITNEWERKQYFGRTHEMVLVLAHALEQKNHRCAELIIANNPWLVYEGWSQAFIPYKALEVAMQNKDRALVDQILAIPDLDLQRASRGCLVLGAVAYGWNDVAKYLVSKGADVNCENTDGDTALDMAVKKGNADMAAFLKGHGGQFGKKVSVQEAMAALNKLLNKWFPPVERSGSSSGSQAGLKEFAGHFGCSCCPLCPLTNVQEPTVWAPDSESARRQVQEQATRYCNSLPADCGGTVFTSPGTPHASAVWVTAK